MSFIESPFDDFEDVTDPAPAPEGKYELVIDSVKEKKNDSGDLTGLLVILKVHSTDGAPLENVADVMHNISFKQPGDDDDKAKNKARFTKRFFVHFGIPFSNRGFDLQDFPGKSAVCDLTLKEYNGMVSNNIKLPNLV